ncbi:MAG TPA: patatin-like phospholipase family protein [Dehalococcoidia bacterium]|nr:patatin-like phospholipase family protein [Dehalococcoidia bacterium]
MRSESEAILERLVGPHGLANPMADAVFEGGGVKAIAQVGAIDAAAEIGLGWNQLAGTSGGAIVAALLASRPAEGARHIWEVLTSLDLSSLFDVSYLPNLRFLRRRYYFLLPLLPNLLLKKGAFEGDRFQRLLRDQLYKLSPDGSRADLTFGDFRLQPRESWQSRHRLKVVATDITRRRPVVFPDDAEDYREFPDRNAMPVYKAVRASMSIPLLFKPLVLHEKITGKPCLLVDGGVSSNYPIWLFDRPAGAGRPLRPTFGFLLDEGVRFHDIRTPLGLLWNVFHTAQGAMDRRLSPWDEDRTVRIPVRGVRATQFTLSPSQQRSLYDLGYQVASEFFRRFDWQEHVRKYRAAPNP